MKYQVQPPPPPQVTGQPQTVSVAVPPVTGAMIVPSGTAPTFYAWLPSTWPVYSTFTPDLIETLRKIFDHAMLGEISNVIADVQKSNGDLQQRGHVVAIPLLCALDAISAYPYRKQNMSKFVSAHFPTDYKPYANSLYSLYRNSMIHSWNLFKVAIRPGNEPITKPKGGILEFGLMNFFQALKDGTSDFLTRLETDKSLQTNTVNRYKKLRKSAKA